MKTFKTDHIGSLKLNSTQFLTLCGQTNANFFQIFKAPVYKDILFLIHSLKRYRFIHQRTHNYQMGWKCAQPRSLHISLELTRAACQSMSLNVT